MLMNLARYTRRAHTPASRAQVAVAAMREDKTIARPGGRFELHPDRIDKWSKQLSENSAEVFGANEGEEAAADPVLLHARIGEVAPKNNFSERTSTRAGLRGVKP